MGLEIIKNKPKFKFYKPEKGHPDFDDCLQEASELAQKITPLIKTDDEITIPEKARDLYRKTSSLKKFAENFIINRKRFAEGNHALRPLYVIWTMLNACNFRCSYCDNHQGEHYFDVADPNRLNTAQGMRLLDVMITGTPAIYWCGGEPTMRKDLPELLDYAWKLGYFPNMINTNASILHKRLQSPQWENFLWQMDIVIVSLDGLNLNRLDELWGVKQARQVFVNLLMLTILRTRVKFKLMVNTVITPETINEARQVLDLACDLDIWFVPVPVNYKHQPNHQLIDNPDYQKLAKVILERKEAGYKIVGSKNLLSNLLFAKPYKCFTALKAHVWSDGKICWPCRASQNTDPVDIDLLDYESFDQAYQAARKIINPDFFHGPDQLQCGGQCAWMQNYTTARYLEGITHPVSSGIIPELFEFAINTKNW